MRVIVSDGGSGQGRSAVGAVRALAQAGHEVFVGVTGPGNLAASSRHCSGEISTPSADAPGYADSLIRAQQDLGAHTALLLASDAALVAFERPEAAFVDKDELVRRCAAVTGLEMPESIRCASADDVASAASSLGFPLIVKPVVSTRPAEAIPASSQLPTSLDGDVIVQPFLDGVIEAVSGVMHEGSLIAVVHQQALRTWPVDAGPSCAAITVDRDRDREAQLTELLQEHNGIFQAQFLAGRLIDLNPRVYGSISLAVAAGANLAALAVDPPSPNSPMIVGRPGVHYRWLEGDLRHLLATRSGLLAHRPFRRTAHSVASMNDPRPQIARLRFALRRG